MRRGIHIEAAGVEALADLNDTRTASAIWDALPLEATGNRWGDEIYFDIPVRRETEKGQVVVQPGDLGYWAPGMAFCVFFGPTPASKGDEVRAASVVTVIGRVRGDPRVFRSVPDGAIVRLSKASGDDQT